MAWRHQLAAKMKINDVTAAAAYRGGGGGNENRKASIFGTRIAHAPRTSRMCGGAHPRWRAAAVSCRIAHRHIALCSSSPPRCALVPAS